MKCKKCGTEAGNARYCPNCGAELNGQDVQDVPKKKKKKWIPIVVVVVLILAVIGMSSSNDPSTTAGSKVSTQPTAQQTEAAGGVESVSTPAPTPTLEPTPVPDDLEILDYTSTSDQYFRYVTGHIKNNTNRTYSYVQVEINTYKGETLVGSTLDNVTNLAPGDVWEFKAMILEDDADSFRIVDVTGW